MGYRHRLPRTILAVAVCVPFLLPIYLLVVNSLKPNDEILLRPAALPVPPSLDGFAGILERDDAVTGIMNSLLILILTTLIILLVGSMLAYALHVSDRWLGRIVTAVLLAGLILPAPVILIPVFEVLRTLSLSNTLVGVVGFLAAYYLPFGMLVYRSFLRLVPREIFEAARLDGASQWSAYWRVALPLMRPAAGSVLVVCSVWVWNEFLPPLVLLGPLTGNTVTVGLFRSVGQFSVNLTELFAYMLVASAPIVFLYVLLQRQFVRGLTAGSTN